MPSVSRMLGQMHFEDLEPHRFEDLIRALIYEFRPWRKIEATSRLGSDGGYDVRAWERVVLEVDDDDRDEEEVDESRVSLDSDRRWLIQCKREKTITPKKLAKFLDEIREEERRGLYGIVFAGACDFSMKARNVFRDKCVEFGVSEFHLWGKGELEDMLVQPRNDHLLFAHFGVSLTVRRRSLRTELRSRLSTKRKAMKVFGKAKRSRLHLVSRQIGSTATLPRTRRVLAKNSRRFLVGAASGIAAPVLGLIAAAITCLFLSASGHLLFLTGPPSFVSRPPSPGLFIVFAFAFLVRLESHSLDANV